MQALIIGRCKIPRTQDPRGSVGRTGKPHNEGLEHSRLPLFFLCLLVFIAPALAQHTVDLTWTASTTPGTTADIFRAPGTAPATGFVQIATGIAAGGPFTDASPLTGPQSYYIAANLAGVESVPSSEVSVSVPPAAATWFVRADGGTRAQCTGQADAAYPGSGTGQACAYKDPRLLYSDDAGGALAWVIAGGDTVIIRGGPWRIGSDTDGTVASPWCGGAGNQACYIPSPPDGTLGAPTIIEGENCISGCPDTTTGGIGPNTSLLTELYGGFGLFKVIQESGAFVQWKGLGITRHSDCVQHGFPALPSTCNNSIPFSDFAVGGINTSQTTHDILFQDIWIHGFPDRGVLGPIGGTITCTRCRISYNGMAGWDFDDGQSHLPSVNNPLLVFNYSILEFSGCNQEYPYTHTYPVTSCYSQSSAGYGDGVATVPGSPLSGSIDHSITRYNTQDGQDWGHVDTGTSTLSVTNSTFYGNSGQQFKWGYNFSNVTMQNNRIVGNCERMSAALNGAPSTYNANLGDFCRAGSTVSFNFRTSQTTSILNNTFITNGPGLFTIGCSNPPANGACATDTLTVKNNIAVGYEDPATFSGGNPGGYYCQDNTALPNPGQIGCAANFNIVRANNLYYQMATGGGTAIVCPTGYSGEICVSPLLSAQPTGNDAGSPPFTEAQLDLPEASSPGGALSFALTGSSPAIAAGTTPCPTTDFAGVNQTSPCTIGALVFAAGPPTVAAPTASPVAGTYSSTQSVALSTVTAGAAICYTIDGTTPAAATAGTCSHGTTYSGAITVSVTTTIMALGTLSGDTNSSVATFAYTITVPTVATPTASPVAGTYTSAQSVVLSDATSGAAICFTTDGTTPTAPVAGTCSGGTTQTYSTAISVASTTTIKALGTKAANTNSGLFTGLYTITPPATPGGVVTGTIKISGTVKIQ